MIPPVKPGDSIRNALTAKVFNRLVRPSKEKPAPPQTPRQHVPVTVQGMGAAIEMYRPLVITGPAMTNSDEGNLFNEYYSYPLCNITATLTDTSWAVAQSPIDISSPGLIVIQGLTWVYANITNLSHKYLKVDGGALVSGEQGKALIITPPAATGNGYCLVMLNSPLPTIVQTVVTDLRVTTTTVQYKTRDLLVYVDDDETDWIDLPSVVCPEVP
jgi:hypothetical protein